MFEQHAAGERSRRNAPSGAIDRCNAKSVRRRLRSPPLPQAYRRARHKLRRKSAPRKPTAAQVEKPRSRSRERIEQLSRKKSRFETESLELRRIMRIWLVKSRSCWT